MSDLLNDLRNLLAQSETEIPPGKQRVSGKNRLYRQFVADCCRQAIDEIETLRGDRLRALMKHAAECEARVAECKQMRLDAEAEMEAARAR